MSDALFPADSQAGTLRRLSHDDWKRLWRRGVDPAYSVYIEPEDVFTLNPVNTHPGVGPEIKVIRLIRSKGPSDATRWILAQDMRERGGWIWGLWIGLLRRQVKSGSLDARAACYGTLLEVEEGNRQIYRTWMLELLSREGEAGKPKRRRNDGSTKKEPIPREVRGPGLFRDGTLAGDFVPRGKERGSEEANG